MVTSDVIHRGRVASIESDASDFSYSESMQGMRGDFQQGVVRNPLAASTRGGGGRGAGTGLRSRADSEASEMGGSGFVGLA